MEFLVIGRYPLSRVRTMPVKYSLLVEWFVPFPVEFNSSLLRAKDLYRLSPKTPVYALRLFQKLPLLSLRAGFWRVRIAAIKVTSVVRVLSRIWEISATFPADCSNRRISTIPVFPAVLKSGQATGNWLYIPD